MGLFLKHCLNLQSAQNVCSSHPEKNSKLSFSFSGTITTYRICSIRRCGYYFFHPVAEGGYSSRAVIIIKQCLLMI